MGELSSSSNHRDGNKVVVKKLLTGLLIAGLLFTGLATYWALRPMPLARDLVELSIEPGTSVRSIAAHGELLWLLIRREIKSRYKDSVLGFFWSTTRPLTMLLIYWLVLGRILSMLGADTRDDRQRIADSWTPGDPRPTTVSVSGLVAPNFCIRSWWARDSTSTPCRANQRENSRFPPKWLPPMMTGRPAARSSSRCSHPQTSN